MTALSGWDNFYVIVGSSAGALIGLQFVLITLLAQIPVAGSEQAGKAFATPTVFHFTVVLFLSGIIFAPWHSVRPAAALCCFGGLTGLLYAAVVTRRMRQQNAYNPELEDWLFHAVFPLGAYAMLTACSFFAISQPQHALFGIAGCVLFLLFIGIHNAWDAATYHVFVVKPKQEKTARNQ
jgi:hypothetical protein